MTSLLIIVWITLSVSIVTSWALFDGFEDYFFSKIPGPIVLAIVLPAVVLLYTGRTLVMLLTCLSNGDAHIIPREITAIAADLVEVTTDKA